MKCVFLLISAVFLTVISPTRCYCVDGIHNVITIDSFGSENLPVKVRNITIFVYDIHHRPSCYKGKVNVQLPGIFQLISGEVYTPHDFDLFKGSLVRATVSLGDQELCVDGKSAMILIPNKICRFDITTLVPHNMCRLLQAKGLHTLKEAEEKINFNSTLELPPSPSFLGITLLDLLKGNYRIKISVDVAHDRIVEFAIPSGFKPLQMGMHDEEN